VENGNVTARNISANSLPTRPSSSVLLLTGSTPQNGSEEDKINNLVNEGLNN